MTPHSPPRGLYIAGPMRNRERWNFPAFRAATTYLRGCGYRVVSPHELDEYAGFTEDTATLPDGFLPGAMRRDLEALLTVQGVVLLPGWETSAGTRFELAVAEQLGLLVYTYTPDAGDGCRLATASHRYVTRKIEEQVKGDPPPLRTRAEWLAFGASTPLSDPAMSAVAKLDELGVPVDAGWIKCAEALRRSGWRGRNAVVQAATRLRRDRPVVITDDDIEIRSSSYVEATAAPKARPLRTNEQNEALGIFMDMLAGPTGDGGNKRAAGTKPSWKIDDHFDRGMGHVHRYMHEGERVDKDSGCHPLIHAAWRMLAVAWQDDEAAGRHVNAEPAA